ncbi:MAG: cyclic nucleotide-binding domain-containing protein [Rhodocyclaceae bacterium]|jgi:CRP/FNR family cyclic AMP-dependent transcriptional regulator|nr:cyclic nucleotide-binding domain-containing protein [Rhodocyclaceae bacterium]
MFLFSKDEDSPRLKQLRALSLFSTLSPRELKTVDGLLHERNYLKDEVIFDQGEEGQALYIIESGKVLICRQGQAVAGRVAELGEGRLFGELALLDNSPRAAQARALENCSLAVLFRADFLGLLETHAVIASKIALQLARHIGQRLRETVNAPGSQSE